MTFTPTAEQAAIVSAATSADANLLIEALAGAAKTSTLVLIAEALPSVDILCLAFNKKIAVEMQERLPSNCKAMTLNSLGHRVWSEATGRRLTIDTKKTFNLMSDAVGKLSAPERKTLGEGTFAELMRVVDFGKQCGYVPSGQFDRAKRLMDDDEFFNHIEQQLDDTSIGLVRDVTSAGINAAFQGTCDFNDQIFMPTIFHGAFPRYALTLVDEAQDLSALNHATLRKMCKRRIIAVGDSRQAIYGFRGAHEDSMSLLREQFSMTELSLTTSFRLPLTVTEHVRWRAPHISAAPWAIEGEVKALASWGAGDLPSAAAILCRNNAPLFSLAIKLLKAGRHVEVGNADIAKGLLKIMRKFGDRNITQREVLASIDAWELKEKDKNKKRAHGGIEDRADCMRLFAAQGTNLADAVAYAEHLCASTGPLKLLTGHKAKGLEFDHVYFLDQQLIGHDDQEPNLRYVIQTRAKQTLTYIRSEDYTELRMAPIVTASAIPSPA